MEFLKPLVNKNVFVYLFGGGVLDGKLLSIGADHVIIKDEAEKKGHTGEKIELDRYVSRNAIVFVEEDRGQRVD